MESMPMPDNLPDAVVQQLLREPQHLKPVVIESPYADDIERNLGYARACVRDCLERGEAPIGSHLIYTQPGILIDELPEERLWGINAGLCWAMLAKERIFYTDYGWSRGMEAARQFYKERGLSFIERRL